MTKTYTTEEILTRLNAHEIFIAIKPLLGDLIRYISIGNQYTCRDVSLSTFTIIDDLKYKRQFDISEFNTYFMFTSDYEAMKSEENTTISKTETVDTPKEEPQIPEWLQRERVRFWRDAFIASKGQTTFDCSNYADKCLEKFDKRFLNKQEMK